jgi:hypothetical protein
MRNLILTIVVATSLGVLVSWANAQIGGLAPTMSARWTCARAHAFLTLKQP